MQGKNDEDALGKEAGKQRVKSSDDRWINAAVRRSDIIFAEAEEKRRRTENDGEETTPAAEATSPAAEDRYCRRQAHCPAQFGWASMLHRQWDRLQERRWRRELDSSEEESVLPMHLQMILEPPTRTRLWSR